MLDFKTTIFSHNLHEKREFSAANDHCANYPFCDIGVSLRSSSAGWVGGGGGGGGGGVGLGGGGGGGRGEVSPKLVVLLIEEETMLLLEFIYRN